MGKPSDSGIEAWYYNPTDEDQTHPHRCNPNRSVPVQHLDELGVLTWKFDSDDWENNEKLQQIKKERGYNYWDVATVAPGMMEDYENKIRYFFQEHLHAHEEIRFVLDGTGYFDIRDYDEKWIRFRIEKGHLIVLPPGMYHRFTLGTNNYIKAVRMFQGLPCWTQHQRPADEMDARKVYVENVLKKGNTNV
eukprot:Gb_35556 [translate_table: standard]